LNLNVEDEKRPRVTLIVAMRNEENFIEATLISIRAQDYPQDQLEVLVVDGLSRDRSVFIAERMAGLSVNWRVLSNPEIISACAWNVGIENATGNIIGIVSGHCELAPNYVARSVGTLLRTGADLVGGPMRAVSSGRIGNSIVLATSSPFGVGDAQFHYLETEAEVDTVYQGVAHSSLYERIGGFDPEMRCNEDDEFSFRILASGGKIVCDPEIVSHYQSRSTLRRLLRQYYRYGFWKVRLMQKCVSGMRWRHFVPGSFVAGLVLLPLLALVLPVAQTVWGLMALAYLVGAVSATVAQQSKADVGTLILMPIVFVILHIGYGVGFIIGLAYWPIWTGLKGSLKLKTEGDA
jgi:succinoglycan biosynthesis protein ExoA